MTTLQVKIQSLDEWKRGALASLKAAQSGKAKAEHSVSFATCAQMQEVLSPARLEIIKVLVGQGSLAVTEVARLVGRDVEVVRHDVTRLINSGVIERDAEGIRFDYDGLRWPSQR